MSTRWGPTIRGLRYRRGQTVVMMVVIATLAAIAGAAPWYARMTRDQTTVQAFDLGAPASTLRIDSSGPAVPDELVPDDPMIVDPVPSRDATVTWAPPDIAKPGEGMLLSRAGVCDHLRFVEGACPTEPGQIAVSTADQELWGLQVDSTVPFSASGGGAEGSLRIVGVYEVVDGDDPYWYDLVPDGHSGWRDLEIPVADRFIIDPATWQLYPDIDGQSHLDLRVDAQQVDSDDLPHLQTLYDDLDAAVAATGEETLTSAIPDTIDELEHGFDVAGRGIALTVGQLAAVGLVCLVLAALLGVRAVRRDLGLQRLRGSSPGRLARTSALEWLVVALPSTVLGFVGAIGFAIAVRAAWLDQARVLWPPWTSVAAAAIVPIVGSLLVAFLTRRVARAPIPSLLRSTESRAAAGRVGLLVLDVILLAVVGCSILVALTSTESSPLVLLAPALLAVGGGVLVCRLLVLLIGRLGPRWLVRRPALGLGWLEIARGDGLRAMVVVSAVATALLVLTTQAALIGDHNRDHRADVETGAATVYRTTTDAGQVQRALDEIDPERQRATAVATVGRSGDSYRMLYVEPEAFRRIAYGAAEAADAGQWAAITAPAGRATTLTGDRLRVRLTGKVDARTPMGVRATLLDASGEAQSLTVGQVRPGVSGSQVLETGMDCAEGCRLLSIQFDPEGETGFQGSLAVDTAANGSWAPVELDPDGWRPIGVDYDGYRLDVAAGQPAGALDLDLATGGLSLALQSTYLAGDLPVLVSERMEVTVEDGHEVHTPGTALLPVQVQGSLHDATPRLLEDAMVSDLSATTRYGDARTDSTSEVSLWFAEGADDDAFIEELDILGVQLIEVGDAAEARTAYANSSEALASRLNPIAAVLVALLAAGALGLTLAGGWRRRRDDVRALDLAGVPRRVWVRATRVAHLVPVVTGVVVGAVAGAIGTSIAVQRVPIFATAEPAIHLQLDLQQAALGVAVAAALVVLLCVAVAAWRSITSGRRWER
ncbi:ABC transporter permease [Nocardioides sp. BGMRC 2183]|nr:ABC transporter permease [Nocardioides sp. BGMRC 2183]